MLTEEERKELQDLQAIESPTEDDQERIRELLAKSETTDSDSDEDEFDKAFDEAIGDPDSQDADGGEDDGDAGEQDDSSIFTKTDDSDDTATTTTPDEVAELKAQIAAQEQKMKSWEGRITAANNRAKEAEERLAELQQSPAKQDPDAGDTDEDLELAEFIEEFPALEGPIKTMVKKLAQEIVDKTVGNVQEKIETVDKRTKEIVATTEEQTIKAHLDAISQAHPDWEEWRDSGKIIKWIESQPSFIQPGLNKVYREGTTKEVIEMFDAYTGSLGKVPAKGTPKKSGKVQDMMAVKGSTGGPPADIKKVDKDDFDSAWNEAVSK